MATPVILGAGALYPACPLERGDKLRNGCAGDTGTTGELRRAQRFGRNRPKSRELSERQRRLVAGKQSFDPPARERSDADEGFGRRLPVAWARHS